MTEDKLVDLACAAGFQSDTDSMESTDGRFFAYRICHEEYPLGDMVKKLVKAVLAEERAAIIAICENVAGDNKLSDAVAVAVAIERRN